MAVVLATFFQNASVTFAPSRFGLALFICTFYAFGNQAALPELLAARHVFVIPSPSLHAHLPRQ
jgi:hypothetical protein